MPIYEYACGSCGHEFETEQRITDDPVETCPECRSRRVKRLISQTSFVLKGAGWYSDLYATGKDEAKPKAKAEHAGDSPGDASKGESKGAGKGEDTSKGRGKSKGKGSPKAAA